MSTNVPVPTLGTTGYSTPSDSAILNGVCLDIQSAFGNALNLSATPIGGQPNSSLSTPQGQLASSISAMISDCYAQFLQVVSQTDPQYAQGSMQDAIGNIYFMKRIPASGTIVSGTITGAPNTVIPFGVAVAQDYNGNLYSVATTSATQVVIPIGGSIACLFTNMVMGPTAFPSAQPLTIYQTTPGWDAITSTAQVSLGALAESAQAFELRRQQSVASNSQNSVQAVKSYVLTALANSGSGASVYVTENSTSGTLSYGGITLSANSIYVAAQPGVSGISPSVIATAIWQSKSAGCGYTPSVTGSITTTAGSPIATVSAVSSGYIMPGQSISGATYVTTGTTFQSQLTGTPGGIGTYMLSANGGPGSSTFSASTSVVVTDQSYATPCPTYTVNYTAPQLLPIFFQITLASSSNPPSNALTTLQSVIPTQLLAVAGIGATLYGSSFYSTISASIPNAQILSVLTAAGSSFTGSILTNTLTVTAVTPGSASIAIGQSVYNSTGGLISTIGTLGTGTGGVGTYTLSSSPGPLPSTPAAATSSAVSASSGSTTLTIGAPAAGIQIGWAVQGISGIVAGTSVAAYGTYNVSTGTGTLILSIPTTGVISAATCSFYPTMSMQSASFVSNPTQVLTNINQYPVYGTTFLVLA